VQRSKFGGIPNWGRSELGAQSGRKNQPACLSVCLSVVGRLSVTLVHRTQAVGILGNISTAFGTLATDVHEKFYGDRSVGGVKHNRGGKI